jgi:hypothetical protein
VTSIEIRKKPNLKKLLSNGKGSIEKTLALRFGKSRIRLARYAQGKREPELAMAKGESSDSRRIGRATFEAKKRESHLSRHRRDNNGKDIQATKRNDILPKNYDYGYGKDIQATKKETTYCQRNYGYGYGKDIQATKGKRHIAEGTPARNMGRTSR